MTLSKFPAEVAKTLAYFGVNLTLLVQGKKLRYVCVKDRINSTSFPWLGEFLDSAITTVFSMVIALLLCGIIAAFIAAGVVIAKALPVIVTVSISVITMTLMGVIIIALLLALVTRRSS